MTPSEFQLIQTLGVVGVLVIVLGAIMTGRLWPKHHVDTLRKDTLKAATEVGRATGKEVATQLIDHFEGKFVSRRKPSRSRTMAKAIRSRRAE